MAGRKPKPTAMKMLHGNPGKRKVNAKEPKVDGKVVIPKWVPAMARGEFERIVEIFGDIDLLRAADQAALEAYCVDYAAWRKAEQICEKEGEVVDEIALDRHNNPIVDPTILIDPAKGDVEGNHPYIYKKKRHPYSVVAKDRHNLMLKAASLFGFDPSSRSRIQVPEGAEKPTNEDADFDAQFKSAPPAPGSSGSRRVH